MDRREMTNRCTIPELARNCKTGDMLLFSGSGPISDLVRMVSSSEWSHVGVIIRERDFNIHSKSDRACILQSSNSAGDPIIKDYPGSKHHRGVKLCPLEEYLRGYDGTTICYRQLHMPESWRNSRFFRERVKSFIDRTIDRSYETNWIELYRSVSGTNTESHLKGIYCADKTDPYYNDVFKTLTDKDFDAMMLDRESSKELFCVELVMYFYQYLGFVTRHRRANNYNLNDLYGGIYTTAARKIHFRLDKIYLDERGIVVIK